MIGATGTAIVVEHPVYITDGVTVMDMESSVSNLTHRFSVARFRIEKYSSMDDNIQKIVIVWAKNWKTRIFIPTLLRHFRIIKLDKN